MDKTVGDTEHRRLLASVGDVLLFLLASIVYIVSAVCRWLVPARYRRTKSLAGDVVLITGGGGGLGRLLALRLARLKATIVLWDINMHGAEETARMVEAEGGVAHGYRCDLADRQDVYRAAEETRRDVGPVTVLINNAGVVSGRSFLDTPDHLVEQTFRVNAMAHYWTTKAFLPEMVQRERGHIVTVASMAGYVGISKLVDYCGSKFAAVGFDEALRLELESQGVRGVHTTVISPYFIRSTGMFDDVRSWVPTLEAEEVADRTVQAILEEELFVLMPGYLRLMLMFKWVFPWRCVSLFLRSLVRDAAPHAALPSPDLGVKPAGRSSADIALHRRTALAAADQRNP